MDLRLLEYFIRVAEAGSINGAAKELGLSQPALSRSLTQLEHDLGQQLVLRCRTGIRITEAGTILASRAESLLQLAGTIREELTNEPSGRVVIGMPSALRQLVTVPVIRQMRSQSPGTAIRVHEGLNVFLRDLLKQGILDVAIIAVEQVPEAEFVAETQIREPLVIVRNRVCVAPEQSPTVDDVVAYPLALPGRPNVVRKIVDRELRKHHVNMKVPIEPENLELCLDLVRREVVGQTVTLSSALVGRDCSDLKCATLKDWQLNWAVAIHRQRKHTVAVRRIVNVVSNALAEAVASGSWPGAVHTTERQQFDG
jgi:LysR family nitrogen assimilation transcriptional regulator